MATSEHINIPNDVKEFIRSVFSGANNAVSKQIDRSPNTHEETLDQALISKLSEYSGIPYQFDSAWVVRLDTHFLGGGHHFRQWEIADVGVLIQFRKNGKLIRSKIVLMQSKRLYPNEVEVKELDLDDYQIGLARLFREETSWDAITEQRAFNFNDSSKYKALGVREAQYNNIASYESEFNIPVYYMLYNPCEIPFVKHIPSPCDSISERENSVGCRILPAEKMRETLSDKNKGYKPTYSDIDGVSLEGDVSNPGGAGWRLEDFLADLSIQCLTGYVATSRNDSGLNRIFSRRTGPISAAVAITFDAP